MFFVNWGDETMGMIEFEETGEYKKVMPIAKEAAINLTLPESQFMFRRLAENGRFGIFMSDVKGISIM